MNRYSVILLLVSLLLLVVSGCAFQLIEDPAAQDAESMYVATEPADIVGVWDHAFMGSHVPIEFTEDGQLLYYLGSPPKVSITGNYWFEDDKLHFEENFAGLGRIGVYSVLVRLEDGEPVELLFSAVDEPDSLRRSDFERGLTRTELPSAEAEPPTSYLATKPEDIIGVWDHAFMGRRVPIRYAEDGTLYYYMGSFYREEALGEYWFEDDKLHFVEKLAGLNTVGIYSVTVELENGEPVRLSLTGIDDPDRMRLSDYEQGLIRMEEVPSGE